MEHHRTERDPCQYAITLIIMLISGDLLEVYRSSFEQYSKSTSHCQQAVTLHVVAVAKMCIHSVGVWTTKSGQTRNVFMKQSVTANLDRLTENGEIEEKRLIP